MFIVCHIVQQVLSEHLHRLVLLCVHVLATRIRHNPRHLQQLLALVDHLLTGLHDASTATYYLRSLVFGLVMLRTQNGEISTQTAHHLTMSVRLGVSSNSPRLCFLLRLRISEEVSRIFKPLFLLLGALP